MSRCFWGDRNQYCSAGVCLADRIFFKMCMWWCVCMYVWCGVFGVWWLCLSIYMRTCLDLRNSIFLYINVCMWMSCWEYWRGYNALMLYIKIQSFQSSAFWNAMSRNRYQEQRLSWKPSGLTAMGMGWSRKTTPSQTLWFMPSTHWRIELYQGRSSTSKNFTNKLALYVEKNRN